MNACMGRFGKGGGNSGYASKASAMEASSSPLFIQMGLTVVCHRAYEKLCNFALVVLGEDHGDSIDFLSALADDRADAVIVSRKLHNLHLVGDLRDNGSSLDG